MLSVVGSMHEHLVWLYDIIQCNNKLSIFTLHVSLSLQMISNQLKKADERRTNPPENKFSATKAWESVHWYQNTFFTLSRAEHELVMHLSMALSVDFGLKLANSLTYHYKIKTNIQIHGNWCESSASHSGTIVSLHSFVRYTALTCKIW